MTELLEEDPEAARQLLARTLIDAGGCVVAAAERLGTTKFHFFRLLKRTGLHGAQRRVARYFRDRGRAGAA